MLPLSWAIAWQKSPNIERSFVRCCLEPLILQEEGRHLQAWREATQLLALAATLYHSDPGGCKSRCCTTMAGCCMVFSGHGVSPQFVNRCPPYLLQPVVLPLYPVVPAIQISSLSWRLRTWHTITHYISYTYKMLQSILHCALPLWGAMVVYVAPGVGRIGNVEKISHVFFYPVNLFVLFMFMK